MFTTDPNLYEFSLSQQFFIHKLNFYVLQAISLATLRLLDKCCVAILHGDYWLPSLHSLPISARGCTGILKRDREKLYFHMDFSPEEYSFHHLTSPNTIHSTFFKQYIRDFMGGSTPGRTLKIKIQPLMQMQAIKRERINCLGSKLRCVMWILKTPSFYQLFLLAIISYQLFDFFHNYLKTWMYSL